MQAGGILVGSAERDGRRLVSVTINAPADWSDHKKLFDYGFTCYSPQTLVSQGQQVGHLEVISGIEASVPLVATEDVSFSRLSGETPEIRVEAPAFVYAPVTQGTEVGTMQVLVGDRVVSTQKLLAGASVAQQPRESPSVWDRVKEKLPW